MVYTITPVSGDENGTPVTLSVEVVDDNTVTCSGGAGMISSSLIWRNVKTPDRKFFDFGGENECIERLYC